jgi:hypothetical protein
MWARCRPGRFCVRCGLDQRRPEEFDLAVLFLHLSLTQCFGRISFDNPPAWHALFGRLLKALCLQTVVHHPFITPGVVCDVLGVVHQVCILSRRHDMMTDVWRQHMVVPHEAKR